jgi:hypothetical protein
VGYEVEGGGQGRGESRHGETRGRKAGEGYTEVTSAAKDEKTPAKKDEIKMLVSGAIKGEDELEGRPAILDLPVGKGRVIAFNFNPIHRDLNRSDHRFLWNALLNWTAL